MCLFLQSQALNRNHTTLRNYSTLNDTIVEREFYEGIANPIHNSDELKFKRRVPLTHKIVHYKLNTAYT